MKKAQGSGRPVGIDNSLLMHWIESAVPTLTDHGECGIFTSSSRVMVSLPRLGSNEHQQMSLMPETSIELQVSFHYCYGRCVMPSSYQRGWHCQIP